MNSDKEIQNITTNSTYQLQAEEKLVPDNYLELVDMRLKILE